MRKTKFSRSQIVWLKLMLLDILFGRSTFVHIKFILCYLSLFPILFYKIVLSSLPLYLSSLTLHSQGFLEAEVSSYVHPALSDSDFELH